MGAWGTAVFSDDLAMDVRSEYNFLVSINKENSDIEKLLMDYYSDILNCNDPDEDVFWFALSLSEWKKGRLSSFVKEKALSALDSGRDLERWNESGNEKNYEKRKRILNELRETLLSPLPAEKKIKKPTTYHCPWKVGSLLAYRILPEDAAMISESPCSLKYVLLRIIKINRRPISKVCPTEYYNESMLVGLYNWIGSEIPDPKIVENLEFIPMQEYNPPVPVNDIDFSILNSVSEEMKNKIECGITSFFKRRRVTCEYLDWTPVKKIPSHITWLDCDENYQYHIPEFFNTSLSSCPLSNYSSFSISLAKRMEKYLDK